MIITSDFPIYENLGNFSGRPAYEEPMKQKLLMPPGHNYTTTLGYTNLVHTVYLIHYAQKGEHL